MSDVPSVTPFCNVNCNGSFPKAASGKIPSKYHPMLRPNGQVCSISPPSNTPGLNLLVHKIMLAYDMSVSAYNNNIALYTTFQLLQTYLN